VKWSPYGLSIPGGRVRFGSFSRWLDTVAIDPSDISQALRLAAGQPDLVVVDRRVLELLMPGLSGLIVLGPAQGREPHALESREVQETHYVWDHDSFPCKD